MAAKKSKEFNLAEVFGSFDTKITAYAGAKRVSTGSVVFDAILGGGIPLGASIGIAGEQGVGKSTLFLSTAKSFIKQGYKVIYLDYEKSVSPHMLEGFDLTSDVYNPNTNPDGKFIIMWPNTFGQGEQILDATVPSGEIGLVIVDSATFMVPDSLVAEDEKDRTSITNNRPGEQAQLMSKWMEKYLAFGNMYSTAFLYVLQMRTKINFIRTTVEASGGYAIKHGVSCMLLMKRDSYITSKVKLADGTDDEIKVGADVRVWAEKSRIGPSFVEGVITILNGKGVSNIYSYMKWLKGREIQVGDKQEKMLYMQGAGFWTMNLPSGQYKARGDSECYKMIKEHLSEIKDYVNDNGGFKLIISGEAGD